MIVFQNYQIHTITLRNTQGRKNSPEQSLVWHWTVSGFSIFSKVNTRKHCSFLTLMYFMKENALWKFYTKIRSIHKEDSLWVLPEESALKCEHHHNLRHDLRRVNTTHSLHSNSMQLLREIYQYEGENEKYNYSFCDWVFLHKTAQSISILYIIKAFFFQIELLNFGLMFGLNESNAFCCFVWFNYLATEQMSFHLLKFITIQALKVKLWMPWY